MSSHTDVHLHSVKLAEKAHVMSYESNIYLQFVKLTEHALTLTWEWPKFAGFDLWSPYNTTVPARGKEWIKTHLRIKLPVGCYGRIAPRRDLALFLHTDIGARVISEDFHGNLSVLLFSHSENPYIVSHGDKIAKLICEKIYYPELDLVKKLDDTWHGARGFGWTVQT